MIKKYYSYAAIFLVAGFIVTLANLKCGEYQGILEKVGYDPINTISGLPNLEINRNNLFQYVFNTNGSLYRIMMSGNYNLVGKKIGDFWYTSFFGNLVLILCVYFIFRNSSRELQLFSILCTLSLPIFSHHLINIVGQRAAYSGLFAIVYCPLELDNVWGDWANIVLKADYYSAVLSCLGCVLFYVLITSGNYKKPALYSFTAGLISSLSFLFKAHQVPSILLGILFFLSILFLLSEKKANVYMHFTIFMSAIILVLTFMFIFGGLKAGLDYIKEAMHHPLRFSETYIKSRYGLFWYFCIIPSLLGFCPLFIIFIKTQTFLLNCKSKEKPYYSAFLLASLMMALPSFLPGSPKNMSMMLPSMLFLLCGCLCMLSHNNQFHSSIKKTIIGVNILFLCFFTFLCYSFVKENRSYGDFWSKIRSTNNREEKIVKDVTSKIIERNCSLILTPHTSHGFPDRIMYEYYIIQRQKTPLCFFDPIFQDKNGQWPSAELIVSRFKPNDMILVMEDIKMKKFPLEPGGLRQNIEDLKIQIAKQPAFVKVLDYDIEPNTGFLFCAPTPFKVSLYMYFPRDL